MTELEKYTHEHWKSVVLCKECKYEMDWDTCPMLFLLNPEQVENGEDEPAILDKGRGDGWCYKGERNGQSDS